MVKMPIVNGPSMEWLGKKKKDRRGVAFLFAPVGWQRIDMGRALYEREKIAKECDPHLPMSLLEVLFATESPFHDLIDTAFFAQPALFAIEAALDALWRSRGVVPDALLGHSLGEYVAACSGNGGLSLLDHHAEFYQHDDEDDDDNAKRIRRVAKKIRASRQRAGPMTRREATQCVLARATLMAKAPSMGTMVSVMASEEICRQAIEAVEKKGQCAGTVVIAAVNSPVSTVLSGDYVAIQTVVAKLHKDHGTKARKVRTTHADHSPHMQTIANSLAHKVDDILEPSSRALERLGLSGEDDEKFSFVTIASTVSGTTIPPHLLRTGDYWGHHMTGAVRFVDALKALVGTASVFVDVGDGMMQMFGKGTLETVKDKSAYCWMSSLSSKGEKDAEHFDAALKQVVAWRDNPCESDEVSDPGTGTKIIPETVSSDLGKVDISECKIMPTPQQLQCDPAMTKSTKKDENKMSFSVTMPRGASFENLVAFLESQYEMGLEVYDALRLTSESKKMRPVPMRDDQDFKAALELAAR